jgi:hypothetical protein
VSYCLRVISHLPITVLLFLIRFDFYKKTNQIEFFKNKKKLKPVQTDRFWFGLVFQDKN